MSNLVDVRLSHIDLCLFCAKMEELKMLVDALRAKPGECTMDLNPLVDSRNLQFYTGKLRLDSGGWKDFYLTSGFRQGPAGAAVACCQLFLIYRPKHAVMLGICCGDEKATKLTDVIFSSQSYSYDEGKVSEGGDLSPSTFMTYAANNVETALIEFVNQDKKNRHYFTMISGTAVRQDARKIFDDSQKNVDRQAKALDMEAHAFFLAATQCKVDTLGVIKAVSDCGNASKNDDTHARCLQEVATHGLAYLRQYFSRRLAPTSFNNAPLANEDIDSDARNYRLLNEQYVKCKEDLGELRDLLIEKMQSANSQQLNAGEGCTLLLKNRKQPRGLSLTFLAETIGLTPEQSSIIQTARSEGATTSCYLEVSSTRGHGRKRKSLSETQEE